MRPPCYFCVLNRLLLRLGSPNAESHWIDIPASADEGALSAQLRAKAGLLDFSSTVDIPVLARLLLESAKGSCVAVPVEADGGTMLLLQPSVNSSALGAATAQ